MTISGISHTGEGSGSRRDTSSAVHGPAWIQTGWLKPTLLEVDFRVRLAVGSGASMYTIEVSDPVTRELLAMRSRPPWTGSAPLEALAEAYEWAQQAVEVLCGDDEAPF